MAWENHQPVDPNTTFRPHAYGEMQHNDEIHGTRREATVAQFSKVLVVSSAHLWRDRRSIQARVDFRRGEIVCIAGGAALVGNR